MLIKHNLIVFSLISLITLLSSCATPKTPISEAKQNYLDHDYTRSFNRALKPAIHGDAEAQYAIGYLYYYGLGVAKDRDIARIWILRSANQNYAPAIEARKKINDTRSGQSFHSLI